MLTSADPRTVCRPALASDTDDVLEFTKYIWEGEDYIKYVWQDWLHDPRGILAVAQNGPRAVGIAKVSFVSPGQWWLEGLRVDPRYQGLKIASRLHDYTNAWWLENGDGVVRLMTSSERVQVHHLSENTGYERVGEVAAYHIAAADPALRGPDRPRRFEPVTGDQVASALTFALAHLAHSNGLMDSGWRFSSPDQTALHACAARRHLLWWRGGQGLLSTYEDEQDGRRVLCIGFAAVLRSSSLSQLLQDAADLAGDESYVAVQWLAPLQQDVQAALRDAGYSSDWEHTGYLYARPHPGR